MRWYELSPRGFRLQRTPLDVSGPLRTHREQSRAAWVFTSATLAVEGSFGHLSQRLGLDEPRTLLVPSPFDWQTQALCYLPTRMPQPADRDYSWAVIEAVREERGVPGGDQVPLAGTPCVRRQPGAEEVGQVARGQGEGEGSGEGGEAQDGGHGGVTVVE